MDERSKEPMKRPLTKFLSTPISRAASVSSRAARWPLDIFDVSIRSCGSSGGFPWDGGGLELTGRGVVSVILASPFRIKLVSFLRHAMQESTRRKMPRPAVHQSFHCADNSRGAERIRITQGAAPERSEARAHDHGEIDILRFGDDLFFKATGRFVDHQEDHAVLEFFPRKTARPHMSPLLIGWDHGAHPPGNGSVWLRL